MKQVERLESVNDPRLDVFRDLKARNAVRDARLFVAEGPTVVERVLRSGLEVRSVLVCDRKWDRFCVHLPDDVCVLRIADDLAEQLIGFSFHAGVVASVVRPVPPRLAEIAGVAGDKLAGPVLVLAGDRVTDPENVGALIRIAAAFGAAGVILGPGSADPFSRRVLRVSMGNVLFLPVLETADLVRTLQELHEQYGIWNCATVLGAEATVLGDFRFPERSLLLFGNEFDGISASAGMACQDRLTIPMRNGTDSLNIAISAGIFAHEYRQTHWAAREGVAAEEGATDA